MDKFDNTKVRRQERLLDEESAREIIRGGEYGILSMVESVDGELSGYGIPINFAWNGEGYIYLHCAPEGHKLDCIAANSNVSLCVVGRTDVISNKFTTAYESVIVRGKAERNLSSEERMRALELILDKYSPNDKEVGMKYAEKSFHRTEILRITITSISAKSKKIAR